MSESQSERFARRFFEATKAIYKDDEVNMKTVTIEVPEGAEITVNGKPYAPKGEIKLRPEHNEGWFCLFSDGDVDPDNYMTGVDRSSWDQGNGFLTWEEAEEESKRRALLKEIEDFIQTENHRQGWSWEGSEYFVYSNYSAGRAIFGRYHRTMFFGAPKHRMRESTRDALICKYTAEQIHFAYTGERL